MDWIVDCSNNSTNEIAEQMRLFVEYLSTRCAYSNSSKAGTSRGKNDMNNLQSGRRWNAVVWIGTNKQSRALTYSNTHDSEETASTRR